MEESQHGPMNNGPQKFSGWSSLLFRIYDRSGFGGHGIYGFHQTFIPAFNSTTVRVKRPDSEGRRIESSKVKFSTYERQTDQINILLVFHHLNCCQPLRSHYCENQTLQTLKRRLDQPENFWGLVFLGPFWLSFQCPE